MKKITILSILFIGCIQVGCDSSSDDGETEVATDEDSENAVVMERQDLDPFPLTAMVPADVEMHTDESSIAYSHDLTLSATNFSAYLDAFEGGEIPELESSIERSRDGFSEDFELVETEVFDNGWMFIYTESNPTTGDTVYKLDSFIADMHGAHMRCSTTIQDYMSEDFTQRELADMSLEFCKSIEGKNPIAELGEAQRQEIDTLEVTALLPSDAEIEDEAERRGNQRYIRSTAFQEIVLSPERSSQSEIEDAIETTRDRGVPYHVDEITVVDREEFDNGWYYVYVHGDNDEDPVAYYVEYSTQFEDTQVRCSGVAHTYYPQDTQEALEAILSACGSIEEA